jgi:sugar phosphate isomerase/epimerase
MSHNFKISNISLSVYSFGYSAGFLIDTRRSAEKYQNKKLRDVAQYAKVLGLAGIEFPLDRYFPNPKEDNLDEFIQEMNNLKIKLTFDLENFSSEYLRSVAPYLVKYGAKFIRVKISRFYGGNRYNNPIYIQDKQLFYKNMDESLELLDQSNLKILVENHQDIVVADLKELISKYGEERIGVTWDIGNSLPSCETPNSFLNKIGGHIGNIHLKDYKLYNCKDGYIMSRCELGKGVIDFKEIFKRLLQYGDIPMTIELGAFNCRIADINNSEYWDYSGGISLEEKHNFINYIKENVIIGKGWKTSWELGLEPEKISIIESNEIVNSVKYLSNLFNGNL